MRRRILIITQAEDLHAIAVAEALERKGAEVTCWATSDFPTRANESAYFGADGQKSIRIHGTDLDLIDPAFDVVWRRRPTYVLDPESLHPADRAFADAECSVFRRSLYRLLAPKAFWVNPVEEAARAGSKLLQHEAACKAGFRMPDTVFTNSPCEIRGFLACHEKTVYKPLSSAAGWRQKDSNFLSYTALLTKDNLVADEVLRQTPGIFQEFIPKEYELRVTVIGRRVFPAKVLSQQTEKGKLDWRRSYADLRFEPTCLPPELEERCLNFLHELGLVFGCFDFIVTPSGEYVFLEVNEMGQFLFVERYCGLLLLDSFSELLLQGRPDFDWTEDTAAVRYNDPEFQAAIMPRANEFRSSHVVNPSTLVDETIGELAS